MNRTPSRSVRSGRSARAASSPLPRNDRRNTTTTFTATTTDLPPRYYFAYGSNLWHFQMQRRCPTAHPVELGILPNFRWTISARGFANVVMSQSNDEVWGLVWTLTPEDERALDRYEGVGAGAYVKYDLAVRMAGTGEERICLVYVDPETAEGDPWPEYVDRLNAGLVDSGLPEDWVQRYMRPIIPPPARPTARHPTPTKMGGAAGGRFYFAYGVDMWHKHMLTNAPGSKVIEVGRLAGFRWVISGDGTPNIIPSPHTADVVFGVVISISRQDEKRLDALHPPIGPAPGGYKKDRATVEMLNGRGSVTCIVYSNPRTDVGIPTEDLIHKMQQAIWDASLPVEWVEAVVRPQLMGPEPQ